MRFKTVQNMDFIKWNFHWIFLMTFLVGFKSMHGQEFYMNKNEQEVRSLLRNNMDLKRESFDVMDLNVFYLKWTELVNNMKCTVIVYFKGGISHYTRYIFKDSSMAKTWIETFNKKYVVKSNTQWTAYDRGKIYRIDYNYSRKYDEYSIDINDITNN